MFLVMQTYINDILHKIDTEIDDFDFYDNNIIEASLKMVIRLKRVLEELREKLVDYHFDCTDEEIQFFKEQKPEILSRLLYFNKIYQIESKFPNGSNDIVAKYLNDELNSLTFYFNRNLDFYQYYRSKSTAYDEYYFIRGRDNIRLSGDSSQFDRDPNFSTVYDYKVAKILANEMLRIYLNKRLQNIDKEKDLENVQIKYAKTPVKFTGKKAALIELGYALAHSGDINNGNVEIKEIMDFLGAVFNIDLGDYYRTYITFKGRKKDRTAYLSKLIEILEKKMDDDDSY